MENQTTGVLYLGNLNMPEDVIKNIGTNVIPLSGEIKDKNNEIIVITQLKRAVYNAHVCHVCRSFEETKYDYVPDVPGFSGVLLLRNSVKEFDGIKYTMACLIDKELRVAINNWLY